MRNLFLKKDLLILAFPIGLVLTNCQQSSQPSLEEPNISDMLSQTGLTLGQHFDALTTICLGQKIALSAGLDYSIRAWDPNRGQLLWTISSLNQPVTSIAMAEAYHLAVFGMADGQVALWNLETRTKIMELPGLDRGITAVAISPDQRYVAAGGFGGSLNVWLTQSGQMLFRSQRHSKAINELKFSANNRFLASASDDYSAAVWELKSPEFHSPKWLLQEHQGWVTSLSFSPKTQWIATASADHYVRIWSLKTGKLLRKFYGLRATISKIKAIDEQKLAAVGSTAPPASTGPENRDYGVALFNIKTGLPEFQASGHKGPVVNLRADSRGNLITASLDESIRSWGM